jgi:hypothetical protein
MMPDGGLLYTQMIGAKTHSRPPAIPRSDRSILRPSCHSPFPSAEIRMFGFKIALCEPRRADAQIYRGFGLSLAPALMHDCGISI